MLYTPEVKDWPASVTLAATQHSFLAQNDKQCSILPVQCQHEYNCRRDTGLTRTSTLPSSML